MLAPVTLPRRFGGLVWLTERLLRRRWLLRLAQVIGWGVAGTFAVMVLTVALDDAHGTFAVAIRGVRTLLWTAGLLAALGTVGDVAADGERLGLVALARVHGHSAHQWRRAVLVASFRAVAGVLVPPTLVLFAAAVALSPTLDTAGSRALGALLGLLVVLGESLVFAALARAAAALWPGRATTLLLLGLLGLEIAAPTIGGPAPISVGSQLLRQLGRTH